MKVGADIATFQRMPGPALKGILSSMATNLAHQQQEIAMLRRRLRFLGRQEAFVTEAD